MALFHDLAGPRTGDIDFVGKHYTKADKEAAFKDQFAIVNFSQDLPDLMSEFEERKGLKAKCAKDADSLEQLHQERC